jgi:hypothetical protein
MPDRYRLRLRRAIAAGGCLGFASDVARHPPPSLLSIAEVAGPSPLGWAVHGAHAAQRTACLNEDAVTTSKEVGMKRFCFVFIALLTLLAAANAQYKYTTVECPGMHVQFVAGINNSGVMVGAYSTDADPGWHALLIQRGRCIPLGAGTVLQSQQSLGASLNDRGDIVGTYAEGNPLFGWYPVHGFLLDKHGVLTTIDLPTADATWPWAINESGMVVGEWEIADSQGIQLTGQGFTWKDGWFSDVLVPGSGFTMIQAVNARGEQAGRWGPNPPFSEQHGFLYRGGQYTKFDVPFSATATVAGGMNEKGDIVGAYWDGDGPMRGFLRKGAQYTPIDYPGAVMTNLNGINNAGQIVGWYYDADWVLHALLVTPR